MPRSLAYDLKLMAPSNEGFDAITSDGIHVEIKATQANSVAFRSCPEHTIIIKIDKEGVFETCFNGPGEMIWDIFKGKKKQKRSAPNFTHSRQKTKWGGNPVATSPQKNITCEGKKMKKSV